MRALLLDKPGQPESLRVGEADIPEPAAGQVRVRIQACGLNPVDAGLVEGGHPAWSWPHIPGLDVAGVIDAIGGGSPWRVGDRVAFHGDLRRPGGFADYVVADGSVLAPVPDSVDAAAAAALPCAGMTAYQAVVRRLRVAAGQTVLVTAGAGGVGGFAVQLAAVTGARVLATASPGNADYVRRLGADAVIDYRRCQIESEVMTLTRGRGVDAVVDTVGADSATANLGLLKHGGALAAIAGAPDLSAVGFGTAPSVHLIALGAAYSHGRGRDRADLASVLGELLAMVEQGRLVPMLNRTVPLPGVPSALAEIAGRHVRGKIVQSG